MKEFIKKQFLINSQKDRNMTYQLVGRVIAYQDFDVIAGLRGCTATLGLRQSPDLLRKAAVGNILAMSASLTERRRVTDEGENCKGL